MSHAQFETRLAEVSPRFSGWVPHGEAQVFDPRDLGRLAAAYVATDPTSSSRSPASVRFPSGRDADAADAWAGSLPYDPAKVTAPVLIIRGEWDPITTDADARRLFDALSAAPVKHDIKISRATHVMQFESARSQLYDEVAAFRPMLSNVGISQVPSTVIVRPGRKAVLIQGFVDAGRGDFRGEGANETSNYLVKSL